jgi:ABC-type multidrug transport system ATPase subunit
LALIKKPAVLILDEPTAGVDVQSRQVIWNMVRENENVTGLIACHSLEEGEHVSTRIMVMSKGKVAFMGTAAELRSAYNCGYYLTFVDDEVDMDRILEFVKEMMPEAQRPSGRAKAILIPDCLEVADLLEELERHKDELGITKYTVLVEDLEDTMRKMIESEEDQA